jgi:hypothetical protein
MKTEKSLRSKTPLFLVGKDSQGHWVVRDQRGLCGGLFVGQSAALKFAKSENGNRPADVVMVPGVLELDWNAKKRRRSKAALRHVA